MRILLVSDLQGEDNYFEDKIQSLNGDYDLCIVLGDILSTQLNIIKDICNKPIIGVTGDFDTYDLLKRVEIEDIDCKIYEINGLKIGGFSGSVKYKHGMFSTRTQNEATSLLSELDKCDILVSHETGFGYMDHIHKQHEEQNKLELQRIAEKKKAEEKVVFSKLLSNFFRKSEEKKELEKIEENKTPIPTASEERMYEGFHGIDKYLEEKQPKYHIFGHHQLQTTFNKYNTKCMCVNKISLFDTETGIVSVITSEQESQDILEANTRLQKHLDDETNYLNKNAFQKIKSKKE